jgi:hypothetical protein
MTERAKRKISAPACLTHPRAFWKEKEERKGE